MKPVFLAQWMKEKRSPFMVLMFCGLSIIATLLFGSTTEQKSAVGVYSSSNVDESIESQWMEQLNDSDIFEFFLMDEEEARTDVESGRREAVVHLMEDDYRIFTSIDNPNIQLVDQHIRNVFEKELKIRDALALADDDDAFRTNVDNRLDDAPIAVASQGIGGEERIEYNMNTQLMFAFSLFLAMFTIGFKVNAVTVEKASGMWNRLILSPVSKTEMYMGHLMYSFVIGFVQIVLIFLIFRFGFGFDLGERFGMLIMIAALFTLSMVAFSMLIAGILRTPEQFYMIFPSVIPMMPLLSGAYMPPGMITNQILLTIAEFLPLTHAMEALRNVAMYDLGWTDLYMPIAKLILITVVCMGVGVNLVERGVK